MRRALPLLLAVLLLTGCSVGSKQGATESSSPSRSASSGTPSSSAGTPAVAWRACGGYQCGTVTVPLDYADPSGRSIKLALLKRSATGTRTGSLLVDPGGPGASGVDFAKSVTLPTSVTQHVDIVGFDPRGVGQSEPALDCHSHLQQMYDADPTMEDAADRAHYLEVSRAYVDECATKEKGLLSHLGTLDVARDLDRIREALGEKRLNYLGYSYGTVIGQMYAQLFPTRIRTMVLDGVVDTQQTGLQAADGQAVGFEDALQAYLRSYPASPVTQLIAKAEAQPIPAASEDRPATPGVVQLAIGAALYSKGSWPTLSQAIDDGMQGDGSGLVELADSYLDRQPDGSYGNGFDIYFAVSCLDSAWPTKPSTVFANAKAIAAKAPVLGEGLVNDYVRCALWPVKPQPLPRLTATGSPPIVVVSTTGDPATPYAAGVKVANRLPQGVLITNVGDGHTVFGQGKACVDDAVARYLVDATPPQDGLRCP
ncbi:alpha/beta hydrolase [Nocardioides mangrovicus]|uniref:Alpha/beta hydrolase n=1 Tax=Nocardioides mangrovicus TaxID=2478913 RepID=A0A3L8P5M0_9ACTN|nr:alpha/beta hydrolase [Nocardioides mangrovicus]RLV50073.1 alpha/beta hydrolase [Nocardioides mangrovicus]